MLFHFNLNFKSPYKSLSFFLKTSYIPREDDEEESIDTRLQIVHFEDQPSPQNLSTNDKVMTKDSCEQVYSTKEEILKSRNTFGDLNLNMSAKEMRARLGVRKREDPRRVASRRRNADWWSQYRMIQTL